MTVTNQLFCPYSMVILTNWSSNRWNNYYRVSHLFSKSQERIPLNSCSCVCSRTTTTVSSMRWFTSSLEQWQEHVVYVTCVWCFGVHVGGACSISIGWSLATKRQMGKKLSYETNRAGWNWNYDAKQVKEPTMWFSLLILFAYLAVDTRK